MKRTIFVNSREERDNELRAKLKEGYKLIDCYYHVDVIQKGNETIRIVDVRE